MLPYVPTDAVDILDIGCSSGQFTRQLKQPGRNIIGIEMDKQAADTASLYLDSVLVGPVEAILPTIKSNSFDCIIMNDVLEHLVDPWTVLAGVRRLLRPRGSAVASIPNIRHWTILRSLLREGEWQYTEVGILDRTHLRFFTRDSIIALFEGAGFKINTLHGINPTPPPWKLMLLARFFSARPDELQYQQFAVVAQP